MEEKKPGSDWEESEQLGPYQLHEQVPQSTRSRGELYRATHEANGAAALVLKPTAEDKDCSVPQTDWQVRCISSSAPNYLAVEVERSPWTFAPDRHSVEELECMFEDLQDGVSRMARAFPAANEPRPWWRLGLALASAAAVCALVFAVVRLTPTPQPPGDSDSWASAEPAPMSHEVPTDIEVPVTGNSVVDTEDGGIPALAHPFPRKPYKGQKRPPCTPRVEVEIMGACWVPHELKAPCPEELYEYQGKCYTTSMLPQRPPQSIEQ
jgi:hypothetical protein